MIEPIMILALGATAGSIILAILLPFYSLANESFF